MSSVYPGILNFIALGDLDWTTHADGFRVYATSEGYNASHVELQDLSGLLGYVNLSSRVIVSPSAGVVGFDCADFTIPAITGVVAGLVLVRYSAGDPDASELVAYLNDASGFPFTMTGASLNITVGSAGLFSVGVP